MDIDTPPHTHTMGDHSVIKWMESGHLEQQGWSCREHGMKWKKLGTERKIPWDHLYVESKRIDLTDVDSILMVLTGGSGDWGEGWGDADEKIHN